MVSGLIPRKWTRTRMLLLVAAAAVVTHALAIRGGFVWLDHAHLEQRAALVDPATGWWGLFATGFAGTGFYRPLVSVSLSLDDALGGAPWLYHATNIAWHAGAAVLTALAAEALGLGVAARLFAGLVFATHPASSLVASAVAFRSEAMIAVALLALVIFHLKNWPFGAALSLLCGALTKETALVLGPLFVVALEVGHPRATARRSSLFLAEAGALLVAIFLRLRFAPTFRATFPELSASEALGTRFAALAKSGAAMLSLSPFDRTLCDAFPVKALGSLASIAGALLLSSLLYLAWRRRGAALLLALALLPSLHLVPIMRWWSPHYLYLPLAFGAMVAGDFLAQATLRPLLWTTAVLAALVPQTVLDDFRFRSDEALWQGEIARHPECREGQFYLGEVHRERKDWAAAAGHYERAIASDPRILSFVDLEAAFANLGVVRLEQHRPADGRAAFGSALALSTEPFDRRRITHDLATAALLEGDAEGAARELEAEALRDDALPESLLVRARALQAQGRAAEAQVLFERLAEQKRAASRGEGK